jgi:uncharacterized protein YdeI (YjbR/CyaY-like superfamily)
VNDKFSDYPIKFFENKAAWEEWLENNNDSSSGVNLKLAKKHSGIPSMTYEEALEIALCYGWIDSQKKSYDEKYWIQVFTPRKAKSVWSVINKKMIMLLIESGKVKPSGMKAVEEAKKNGQWEKAYEPQSSISIPEDLQLELDKNQEAKEFFKSLNSSNRYAILYRINAAKSQEMRMKKIQQFISMLERKEKLHP